MTDFNWFKTLITAFIGALIALLLKSFYDFLIRRKDLNTKKKMIKMDLINQKEILSRLKQALEEFYTKFEKKNTANLTYDAFEDLQIEVYNSLNKTDFFKIYKSDMVKLIPIYKKINFLKKYSIDKLYGDYLIKVQNHLTEKKSNPEHDYYCSTHIGFIDAVKRQTRLNIKIINELNNEINAFIKIS